MPSTALKHLAKAANVSLDRAEHLWHKAKEIVSKEYGAEHKGYYALVMGITKKMLGLSEELTSYETYIISEEDQSMDNILRNLMMAQRCAHVHHWKVKSLSLHLALGELYELLTDFADELAEFYMGLSGETVNPAQSDPNHFDEQNPLAFIRQLHDVLADLKSTVPNEGLLVNKYEELQGEVAKIKYKMENLK